MPWQAVGHAPRALVLLDPAAVDVYRMHLAKGDLEHDLWPYDTLYPEYLAAHGLRSEARLRFGAYLTMMGLFDTEVDVGAIFREAEKISPASRFAEIVMDEAASERSMIELLRHVMPDDPFEGAVGGAVRKRLAERRHSPDQTRAKVYNQ